MVSTTRTTEICGTGLPLRSKSTSALFPLSELPVDFLDQAEVVNLIQRNIRRDFGLAFTLLEQGFHLRTRQGSVRSRHLLENIVSILG